MSVNGGACHWCGLLSVDHTLTQLSECANNILRSHMQRWHDYRRDVMDLDVEDEEDVG